MERSATLENTAREVANMVATKCVNPLSNRPYTTQVVRDAMKEAEFSVQPTTSRSVKQQFLDCVRAVQEKGVLDICRAKMELAIVFADGVGAGGITGRLETEAQAVIVRDDDDRNEQQAKEAIQDDDDDIKIKRIQFLIDPSQYRTIDTIAKESGGTLEMLRHAVTQEGDADVSSELERNTLRQTENDAAAAALKLSSVQTSNRNNNEGEGPQQSQESEVVTLTEELDAALSLDNGNEDDDYDVANSRKKNKKAQKKSKKAKRREKEEATLRQERKDIEIARREEREFRLQKSKPGVDTAAATSDSAGGNPVGATKSCNTCGGEFTPTQYRAHFRSDWHRYNVKLKMKGAKHVDEKEFLMIDSDAFFDGAM